MAYRCPDCGESQGYVVLPGDSEYVICNACGSVLSKDEIRDAKRRRHRCPFCGRFSTYTRLDFDIWQCNNCLCFLSSADFERPIPGQTPTLTPKAMIVAVLLGLFVCAILFAMAITGALP